ncbi:MAG: helix-turn-helix domain-containing protein [Streptosporangiaceae bacterium]
MSQPTNPAAAAATAATSQAGSTPTAGAQVGSAVRRLREHAGLSLSEVARRSGVGKATLSRLEAGERNRRWTHYSRSPQRCRSRSGRC